MDEIQNINTDFSFIAKLVFDPYDATLIKLNINNLNTSNTILKRHNQVSIRYPLVQIETLKTELGNTNPQNTYINVSITRNLYKTHE